VAPRALVTTHARFEKKLLPPSCWLFYINYEDCNCVEMLAPVY